MNKPLISVIVPVYNVEKYIFECVESLVRQTYPELDIVLVDDGSPDNCPKICEDFAAKYDNIRVIHQGNRGLSGARNTGIDHARGSLITFADSDDTLHLDAVEKLYEQLETHGTAIATAGVTDDKPISGVFSAEEAIGLLLKETTNLTTAAYGKLFDIRLFDDIRFPEGLVFEDYATIPWLFAKAGAVAHTGEKLYDYRLNPDSITKAGFSPRQMQYFTVSDRVERFVEENYPKLRRHARNRKTQFSVAYFRRAALSPTRLPDCEKQLVGAVRKGIFSYIFSAYKSKSKLFGVCIALCPPLARRLAKRI